MKLKESIPSNSVKIIDLYNKIDSNLLDTSPDFQRKLVWKKQHKYHFIETVLKNYPFPEVYIASSEMNVEELTSKEIVVDGKQRLTAIVEYIKGVNDFKDQKKIKPFSKLDLDEKRDFLNYLVTVKDLKDIGIDVIKEVFKRINSTEYSLNTIEKTNAQYGDGEFAIFCKQIVISEYSPSNDDTDIILEVAVKSELNNFFLSNNIFNENDKTRMFDIQYIMLIMSTILEGDYYSRSLKVNEYLEKYNSEFNIYETPLSLLLESIRQISQIGLNNRSYWFNKANLFTLIVELTKEYGCQIDLVKLESKLRNLELNADLYFSEDESVSIMDEEKKYFEYARQGSHEKAARIYRGKIVSGILKSCCVGRDDDSLENKNVKILSNNKISFAKIIPTKTGLSKSIMDATLPVREFLKNEGIHDYQIQESGSSAKVIKSGKYITCESLTDSNISLYKATKRGDARIWFSDLPKHASANDIIAIAVKVNEIYLINLSNIELAKCNTFKDVFEIS